MVSVRTLSPQPLHMNMQPVRQELLLQDVPNDAVAQPRASSAQYNWTLRGNLGHVHSQIPPAEGLKRLASHYLNRQLEYGVAFRIELRIRCGYWPDRRMGVGFKHAASRMVQYVSSELPGQRIYGIYDAHSTRVRDREHPWEEGHITMSD
jgi:hypothetical protein